MSRWTQLKKDKLEKLWSEGCSGSQIAKMLGRGFTRGSVLGKVRRMDLPRRAFTHKTPENQAES